MGKKTSASGTTKVTGHVTFNPGVHKSTLFGSNPVSGQGRAPWKGSIVVSAGLSASTWSKRYGFRFHFNPTEIQVSTSMDDTSDLQNQFDDFNTAGIASVHQQAVSLDLKLWRAPDMEESDTQNFYPPVSRQELKDIKARGTLIDIEYIFRAANGDLALKDHGYTTADVGFLQPAVLDINLGPNWRFYGFINQVIVSHHQFTDRMVPVHSDVHLDLIRMSSISSAGRTVQDPTSSPFPTNPKLPGPGRQAPR